MDTLTGSVERITYFNAENGYTVLRLRPENRRVPGSNAEGLVTVTGNLPEISPGEHLRLSGEWGNHPKHGMQFQASICEQILPATLSGIRRYLGSGLIKGIGPRLAERIVAQFGPSTLDVIEHQPELLQQVPDIGAKRAAGISAAWEEQKQVKEIMLFLHSHGISTGLAVKIYRHYGSAALNTVQNDPYSLARDIFGIGFKTADRIAQAIGLQADHPSRVEAGVVYSLNRAADDGHVYLPRSELIQNAADLLAAPSEVVEPAIRRLEDANLVHCETPLQTSSSQDTSGNQIREAAVNYQSDAVYLMSLYRSEAGTAERLRNIAAVFPTRLSDTPPAFISIPPGLSEQQQAAVRMALSHPLSVLTGGPGTGKTTTLKALIGVLDAAGKSYALASPTGRAAKRLSQATGRPASTIHRLLGFKPGEGFKFNTANPLNVDMVVIDESSMLDLYLAYSLLRAVPTGAHLLFVGDVDQLPSVGAGDVLRDVIAGGIAAVTRLEVVFRQAANSTIITNAHRINHGELPLFPNSETHRDFFLFPCEDPEEAARWVVEVVSHRIPQKFGLHPLNDIQVLAPMYRGPAGVNALNERLQAELNPSRPGVPEKILYGHLYRAGDKLLQTQNNYDKEVFNGDIGVLESIDPLEHVLEIDFEGRRVTFDWSEADQLISAYAVSVHKAQGAEFPAIVMPLVTQHYLMLQRNLLYTAITRARQLCVLVGSRRAIAIAIRNNAVAKRFTGLEWRIGGFKAGQI